MPAETYGTIDLRSGTDIAYAKSLLEGDELVAIPTETVYGLAANGLSSTAVVKIFETKQRPTFNPLILHVPSLEKARYLVKEIPAEAELLAKHFWPGPLTLILPKSELVPDIVTGGNETVGIRVPAHPLTLDLLYSLDFPLAAPSANPFGYISPTKAEHVQQQLGDKIPYVLDGGPCNVGIESTIVRVEGNELTILRLGGVNKERIEAVAGDVKMAVFETSKPIAPGMLRSHYAPGKKVILGDIDENIQRYAGRKTGVLSFHKLYAGVEKEHHLILSPTKNLHEAARNIFDYLRRLDALDVEIILAELLPEEGLGAAINDRLRRAAADKE